MLFLSPADQEGSTSSSGPWRQNPAFPNQTRTAVEGSPHQTGLRWAPPEAATELTSQILPVSMPTMSYLCSHRVIIKPCQADDFLNNSSIGLVHLDAVEPGTQGQSSGDAHGAVSTVGTQLQHCQRALLHQ